MLILLEGVDAAGKSTLASTLANIIVDNGGKEPVMLHRGPPEDHPLEEYEHCLDWYRPGSGDHVICDRWHIGADVYGPLMRGDKGLEPEVRWHIEAYLRSRGAFLVLVEPPSPEEMLRRMHVRGEDYVNDAQALHCLEAFRPVVEASHVYHFRHNGTTDPAMIVSNAKTLEMLSTRFTPYPSYVGPPLPRVLLLGDKRRTFTDADPGGAAAFMPFPSTSGQFLLEALGDVDDVGIANACEIEDLKGLWEAARRPEVVALGVHARDACDGIELPHKQLKHPQYVRRFQFGTMDAYGKELRA